MLAIIDYGVGNLFSLQCSLNKIGEEAVVTSDESVIESADRIILPGVGAFGDAVNKLKDGGMFDAVLRQAHSGKPLLGICLGMQLLFEKSYEYGEHKGLGLIEGEIIPLKEEIPSSYAIPHMGWNALKFHNGKNELFKYINEGDCVYFVHSYFGVGCEKSLIASAEYGAEITAAVASGNVFGCQFHPEKSGDTGLNILRAFCEMR